MYQNPLTIQKGVRNTIQLQFKNSDQKRLNISTQTFVMNVFDPIDDTLLLTKPVTILDTASTTTNALKGIGQVTFSEADTLYTEPKNYRFSVVKLEEDGSYSPTYANTYYGVSGTMEIKNDVLPNLKPSVTITDFQRNFNSSTLLWEYSTGNLRADPEFQSNGAVHTVAFFMTNFKGQVLVEGTLENSPTYYAYYAKLATKNYDGYSGGAYVTFTGLFTYIRVRYIPTANPTTGHNNDTTYAGTFDKVQYRS